MARILVTPRSLTKGGDPSLDLLRQAGHELVFSSPGRQPDEDELRRLVPGCLGWIAGVERITAEVLRQARELRAISRNGTGVDTIDLEACRRQGIKVLRAEGANSRGVAELALGHMLALARSIPWSDAQMRAGKWERRAGSELEGKTLGLLACGRIGQLVARYGLALEMQVVAYDVDPQPRFSPGAGFRWLPLRDVLAASDVLSLHCPHVAGEPPVLGESALRTTKTGVLVVNTARAGLVDPDAMLRALEEGRVGGYAVDVFENEPPGPMPLLAHPRVVSTPHLGALTAESVARATRMAVDNLLAALEEV
jgi:D-3-phosphoglycerate dehydrogenase / 2-oxoglutarate reductase